MSMGVTARRRNPRSAPTKPATNAVAGRPSTSAGVSTCSRMPPWRSTAMRSPRVTASSMSWVTKITVFLSWPCRLRNSCWRRSRAMGSTAAEGLVHEKDGRVTAERPGHPDALLLAAGQLVGIAPHVRAGVEPHELEQLGHPGLGASLVPAEQPRHGGHVVRHLQVGEQPGVLDHVADAPAQPHRVHAAHVLAVEEDPARAGVDEPVDHLEGGRLAAARGPHEHAQLAVVHLEVQPFHCEGARAVALGDGFEADHARPTLPTTPAARAGARRRRGERRCAVASHACSP